MIWLLLLFLAVLPRFLAQLIIVRWPERHGAILLIWAAFSLGFVPYLLLPAVGQTMPLPKFAMPIYFSLFMGLMVHFEWRFGPKQKDGDDT